MGRTTVINFEILENNLDKQDSVYSIEATAEEKSIKEFKDDRHQT